MNRALDTHLSRVEWDELGFPVRFHPFLALASRSPPSCPVASRRLKRGHDGH
jgi:hypothetical protein